MCRVFSCFAPFWSPFVLGYLIRSICRDSRCRRWRECHWVCDPCSVATFADPVFRPRPGCRSFRSLDTALPAGFQELVKLAFRIYPSSSADSVSAVSNHMRLLPGVHALARKLEQGLEEIGCEITSRAETCMVIGSLFLSERL